MSRPVRSPSRPWGCRKRYPAATGARPQPGRQVPVPDITRDMREPWQQKKQPEPAGPPLAACRHRERGRDTTTTRPGRHGTCITSQPPGGPRAICVPAGPARPLQLRMAPGEHLLATCNILPQGKSDEWLLFFSKYAVTCDFEIDGCFSFSGE